MQVVEENLGMDLARRASQRGNCSRLKVGAMIVEKATGKGMAAGWNGTPDLGIEHPPHEADEPCALSVHAEVTALVTCMAWWPSLPAIMFVTHAPCIVCAQVIALSGFIEDVVWENSFRDMRGLDVMRKAGIDVRRFA